MFNLGVTFLVSKIPESSVFLSNRRLFHERLETNLDFGELNNNKLDIYYDLVSKHDFFNVKIDRSIEIILDIFVEEDTDCIAILEKDGQSSKVIACCSNTNYEKLKESDTTDPYILNHYRRAKLFDGIIVRYNLKSILNIVVSDNKPIFFKSCILMDTFRTKIVKSCLMPKFLIKNNNF